MPTITEKLRALADVYAQKATGLRQAAEELDAFQRHTKQGRGVTATINSALRETAARRNGHAAGAGRPAEPAKKAIRIERAKPKGKWGDGVKAKRLRRQATAKLLARIAKSKYPTPHTTPGMSPLVRHGYLAREGDGYVRTKKVFTP